MIATQSALPASLIPSSLALLIFIQNLSASIVIIIGNTIFTQSLLSKLARYAPSISPQEALKAGGSVDAVRQLVPSGKETELNGILRAYSESLGNVWYLLVGFAVGGFLFAWGTGWRDVRKEEKISTTTVEKKEGEEKRYAKMEV